MERTDVLRSRILEQYVAREFLKLLSLSLVAFVSLFIIVDFFERIDRLVRAELDVVDLLRYFLLKVPFAVGQVLPAAVLLGVTLTFGIMSRNRETMAIRTSGLDILQLSRPAFVIAGGVAAALLALNLYVIPWSQGRLSLFWDLKVEKKPPASVLKLHRFWYKGDQAIYNILNYRKGVQTLEGIKIYLFDQNFNMVQVIAASRAQWQGDHWRFYKGLIQTFGPEGPESGEQFQERDLVLTERPEDFGFLEKKVTEMDLSELSRYIRRLERDGYRSTPYRLDLDSRVSLALTPLILVILGLGLSLHQEKVHIAAVVALGLLVMFAYWLFYGFSLSFAQAEKLPILLAVGLPHLVFGLGSLDLLRRITR
jgi:lipopolysaccharide export system permease protein